MENNKMVKLKTVNLLNKKFDGATLFIHDEKGVDYHKTLNEEKELEIILSIVEEANNLEYDKNKYSFISEQIEEINNIKNMKRLDLKTGLIINNIQNLYEYLIKKEII